MQAKQFWRSGWSLRLLGLLSLWAAVAMAQPTTAFLEASGFDLQDANRVCSEDAFYTEQRFPTLGQSARRPDADLDALSKAVLWVECAEGVLPHARYLVRFHLGQPDEATGLSPSYIEVQRFNLGPLLYQEIVASVDPAYWPPKSVFGQGPHVAWRLVYRPVQGNRAALQGVSRKLLTAANAAELQCLGAPCLARTMPDEEVQSWPVFTPEPAKAAVFYEAGGGLAPGPARVAQLLVIHAIGDGEVEYSPGASWAEPELVVRISKNIEGQDGAIQGILHQSHRMDDAASALWIQVKALSKDIQAWRRQDVPWSAQPLTAQLQ